jgi:N-acetylglucosamine-6-phosphate deacetylase
VKLSGAEQCFGPGEQLFHRLDDARRSMSRPLPSTVIHGATLVTDGRVISDSWVRFEEASVAARGTGSTWSRADVVVNAEGAWLTPGFVDLHCHGGEGASFDEGPDAIRTALAFHEKHGTTRCVLSLVSAPVEALAAQLSAIADLASHDGRICGSHLEGPFLDRAHKGAHDPSALRPPSSEDIRILLDAARGTLRHVTLAPELPGGLDAVKAFSEAGVAVAIGHTDADYDQTLAAIAAGATLLTHAYNAMNGVHHRAPGPVAAATRSQRMTLEVINDGIHVHPEVVRMLFAAAPGRVAMVTDAMAAAGSCDGEYELGGLTVNVRDGVARLAEGGAIAGSTLTLDAALRRAVEEVGVSVHDAVGAVTRIPATALGLGRRHGSLSPGYAADAVLLDPHFSVLAVWRDGQPVMHGV